MTSRPTQPVSAPTGLKYGQRKQLEEAQQAIPLPDNTSPQGGGQAPPVQPPQVFAPTSRPGEPLTAGAQGGAGPSPVLPDMSGTEMLRALIMNGYDTSGDLRRLLERAQSAPTSPTMAPTARPPAPGGNATPGGPQPPPAPQQTPQQPPTPTPQPPTGI